MKKLYFSVIFILTLTGCGDKREEFSNRVYDMCYKEVKKAGVTEMKSLCVCLKDEIYKNINKKQANELIELSDRKLAKNKIFLTLSRSADEICVKKFFNIQ